MKASVAVATVLALALSAGAGAQEFYRYKNDEGQTVMDTTVPAQYVNSGYDVLNSRGELIERVAPVKEDDPFEVAQANNLADRAAADQVLLTSYSTVDEIKAHRLRKLQAIEREISIIESDRRVVQLELEHAKTEHADLIAREREVPADLPVTIAQLETTIQSLDDQLVRRETEWEAINQEFTGKIARFEQLKAELSAR